MKKRINKILAVSISIANILFFLAPVNAVTLNDYYLGKLPSISARQSVAKECGIIGYKGTAKQNSQLVDCLQKKGGVGGLLGAGYTPVTGYQSRTTQYVSASATTIPVASTLDKSGNQIVLSNISSSGTVKVYMNLGPGTSSEEPIICTGVTSVSWTNCTRGVAFQGSSETSSSTLAKVHNAGTAIIITNIGQSYNQYVSVDGTQTINDVKTFSSLPLIPTSTPTNQAQAISLYQFQQATTTGGINGSETAKGVYQLPTPVQMASGTSFGSTGARLVLPASLATSSPSATTSIPITDSLGKLNPNFINTSSNYNWEGVNTWAASSTFNGPLNITSTTLISAPLTVTNTSTFQGTTVKGISLDPFLNGLSYNKLIAVTTTPFSVSSDTGAHAVIKATIPGGYLTTSTVIIVEGELEGVSLSTTKSIDAAVNYGGVDGATAALNNPAGGTETFNLSFRATIFATSTTSELVGITLTAGDDHLVVDNAATGARAGYAHSSGSALTVNTLVDQTLKINFFLTNSSGSDTFTAKYATMEIKRL